MIAIVRIEGMVKVNAEIENTLSRLKLRRKYACVVVEENEIVKGMLKKIRSFVAYGNIDDATLKELIEARGQPLEKDKKVDASKVVEAIKKNKSMKDSGIKPFFRLHPARGGINTKSHFPKGVLGNHKDKINDLIKRML